MGFPDRIDAFIDELVDSNHCFAAYYTKGMKPTVIVSADSSAKKVKDLNEEIVGKAFVMHPFNISESCPMISISGREYLFEESFEESLLGFCERKIEDADISEEYRRSYDLFMKEIESGRCKKLVLSRTKNLCKDKKLSLGKSFVRSMSLMPNSYTYICKIDNDNIWFGATPEQLLNVSEGEGKTVALAGTKKGDEYSDIDCWDRKNVDEQQIVTSYIEGVFSSLNVDYHIGETRPIVAGNIRHLKTDIGFKLGDISIFDILKKIHPTPAVCGIPKEKALEFICETEQHDRKYYSGYVGVVEERKNIDLYVNLRCANIEGEKITLYAGGGIVCGSNINDEWAETERKMDIINSVFTCL